MTKFWEKQLEEAKKLVQASNDISRRDSDYALGYLDGLVAYAWWKDGDQYVGTAGMTLSEAIERATNGEEWNYLPPSKRFGLCEKK